MKSSNVRIKLAPTSQVLQGELNSQTLFKVLQAFQTLEPELTPYVKVQDDKTKIWGSYQSVQNMKGNNNV